MLNKKVFTSMLLLCGLMFISGCTKDQITMIVPTGGPQYAQLYMQDDQNYDVSIVEGADPLVAAFGSETYDVIFAPTNLGAKLYSSKPTYQLIASVSWGSYYLASTSSFDLNQTSLSEIIAFGQNQTPDVILQYVLKGNDIESNIIYLDSLSSSLSEFVLDSSKIYLLSEPGLSVLNQTYEIHTIDLQDAYATLSDTIGYPQASVFANKNLSDKKIKQIKADLESSIDYLLIELDKSFNMAIKQDINVEFDVFEVVVPRLNIKYVDATNAKADIVEYLELLKLFNPKFVGDTLPDDSFYR